MKTGSTGFMKYVYYRAKKRYGKDCRNVISEAIFKHHCNKLRGKPKKFVDVLIELNVLSEEESKTSRIISTFDEFKTNKHKIEEQETEADKNYKKYKHLVQYFIYKYGMGKLPLFSSAMDFDDYTHDCWCVIIQKVDFKFHHKAIVAYISKIVQTQCARSCARMLHIRIPDHSFKKVRFANRWPEHENSWKILASPGNRFVVPLENVDIAITDEECFRYEHLKGTLSEMFNKLSVKERFILTYRFGPEKKTLKEIGVILQYTRERVRQIEEILIRRLRCWMITAKEISNDERERLRSLPIDESKFVNSKETIIMKHLESTREESLVQIASIQ